MKTVSRKKRIRSKRVQRLKIIIETQIVSAIPEFPSPNCLELKRGELCLRKGDEILNLNHGNFRLTKTWLRPGKTPFDQNLYRVKS